MHPVGGLMSYLHYLCLLAYSGVQGILCCVFVLFVFVLCIVMSNTYCVVCFALFVFVLCLVYPMLPVSMDCPFLNASRYSLAFISVLFRQYIHNCCFFLFFLTAIIHPISMSNNCLLNIF